MVPEVILIALLVGWLAKGKFSRLADAHIRYGWLLFVILGLYIAQFTLCYTPIFAKAKYLFDYAHLVQKGLLLGLVIMNIRIPGAFLIVVGMVMNLIALIIHGGVMPASPEALDAAFGAGFAEKAAKVDHVQSVVMDTATNLAFLCDIIAAKRPFVLIPAVYSIGDLVMSTGIFIAIIKLMTAPLNSKSKEG